MKLDIAGTTVLMGKKISVLVLMTGLVQDHPHPSHFNIFHAWASLDRRGDEGGSKIMATKGGVIPAPVQVAHVHPRYWHRHICSGIIGAGTITGAGTISRILSTILGGIHITI